MCSCKDQEILNLFLVWRKTSGKLSYVGKFDMCGVYMLHVSINAVDVVVVFICKTDDIVARNVDNW